MPSRTENPPIRAAQRVIAAASEWQLTDFCCSSGPDDAPFEEEHGGVTIAAVVEGRFRYRGESGTVNFSPGATLLGNAGACYRCDHVHGVGDRCIALSIRPDYFEEIAHAASGQSRFRFSGPMLPPNCVSLRRSVELTLAADAAAPAIDEAMLADYVAEVAGYCAGTAAQVVVAAPREQRRIREICDRLTADDADLPDLDTLAKAAGVSKFHFVRLFRKETATTPHQYRLQARLRRAALRLAQSNELVAHIAFDAGFGDLSTFNARFRRYFGMTPTAFRCSNQHGLSR